MVFLVVRGSSCSNAGAYAKFAVQTLNHLARKIAIDLEVLDWNVQVFECVAEVEARGVELSDVLVSEGESRMESRAVSTSIPV